MPNPRTPIAKAKLTGADKRNPQRFRDRKEPKVSGRPVGAAPSYLTAGAKKAWKTFASELGWLTHEDRAILEVAATMRAEIMAGSTELPASFFTAYRQALAALGGTPTDRSKVASPDDGDDDDPFKRFHS